MPYNFTTLSTVAECDVLLNEASHEKAGLLTRKGNLILRVQSSGGSDELEADIDYLTTQISKVQDSIAENPPPDRLTELQIQLGEYMKERGAGEKRLRNMGYHWEVSSQAEVSILDAGMAVWDSYITELEAYKATLPQ